MPHEGARQISAVLPESCCLHLLHLKLGSVHRAESGSGVYNCAVINGVISFNSI